VLNRFGALQAVRKRPLNISVSATQTAADREPVISVAVGWGGSELRR